MPTCSPRPGQGDEALEELPARRTDDQVLRQLLITAVERVVGEKLRPGSLVGATERVHTIIPSAGTRRRGQKFDLLLQSLEHAEPGFVDPGRRLAELTGGIQRRLVRQPGDLEGSPRRGFEVGPDAGQRRFQNLSIELINPQRIFLGCFGQQQSFVGALSRMRGRAARSWFVAS